MKQLILLLSVLCFGKILTAQYVYTINADSVKLTNSDSSELIIENHTQNVPGFLFNTGNGRTIFKRALQKVNDSLYLIGADSLQIPVAWKQGGNAFGTTGILGTLDSNHLDFYTGGIRRARLTASGHLLIGTTTDSSYRLDVNGYTHVTGLSNISAGDSYDIKLFPGYNNGWAPGINASMISFGNTYAAMGINKQALGNIPANSMLIGEMSPGRVLAIIDNNTNPTFMLNGGGWLTINGGYHGISTGGSEGVTANADAYDFNINGCRGTGTGTPGDIIFSTGTAQDSGMTIHVMTNRWWIKGETGYFSNSSTPTSNVDISGTNGYSQFRLRTSYTPSASSDSNGNTGDFSWDDNYLYIKTSSGWKRSALSTF